MADLKMYKTKNNDSSETVISKKGAEMKVTRISLSARHRKALRSSSAGILIKGDEKTTREANEAAHA